MSESGSVCGTPLISEHSIDQNNNQVPIATSTPIRNSPREELRTLFVSGLPQDVKEREFYLLFQGFSGFECAIVKQPVRNVKLPNNQPLGPVAFLTFASRKDAEQAKDKFHGFALDPSVDNLVMKIEFAKANTKSRYRSRESSSLSPLSLTLGSEANQGVSTAFPLFQDPFTLPPFPHCQSHSMGAHPVAIDAGAFWPLSYQDFNQFPIEAGLAPILLPSEHLVPIPVYEPRAVGRKTR
ncbi:Oidioi.mRNA.OKI2018_I69.XSR.g16170.t1.cds [Oikopleura dioica]|uniref:Oidioi.mRNA.OKI2018_I69.XSR.g16170.t1.cds n=1 Tax=Oikopleura dioica TaxID=34765 RepID=A0ABN7SF90_OIKDI|nr:Oidioi.mRNA.OKI2018_I69.XSR.g16170.t1.cds [Oikopleura dioica]